MPFISNIAGETKKKTSTSLFFPQIRSKMTATISIFYLLLILTPKAPLREEILFSQVGGEGKENAIKKLVFFRQISTQSFYPRYFFFPSHFMKRYHLHPRPRVNKAYQGRQSQREAKKDFDLHLEKWLELLFFSR